METLNWIFFGPAKLIANWHYAGLAIAAGLIAVQAWLFWRARTAVGVGFFREAPVFAGLLWLIFNAYELQMSAVSAKPESLNFRMDLIVLVPILYVLTAAAVISLARQMITRNGPDRPDTEQ